MMWLLSYLGSTFGLILVATVAVISLGVIAWVSKNWKVALAAAVVLAASFAYMQIDKNAYQRRVAEETREQIVVLQSRLATLQNVAKADAFRAAAFKQQLDKLERQASETPPNPTACLPRDAAGRVRAIR